MQDIELVIFDCDGVLVNSEPIVNQVFLNELNRVGVPISLNDLFEHFLGLSLEQCLSLIKNKYGVSLGDEFVSVYKVKRDLALELQVKPIEGIEPLLHQLKLPYCVASNSEAKKVKKMLILTKLIDYFDGKIFSASDMNKPKPAPDVYLKIAAEFKVRPEKCLVIEDTATGIQAGIAAGMNVYGYGALTPGQVLFDAGASRVFCSMAEMQKEMC